MWHYILGILTKLACGGLAPRARNLFDQARIRGKFRWGKTALLVAGASILVALRENKKGVTMIQLAVSALVNLDTLLSDDSIQSLMDISPYALCRVFTNISSLLNLQVPPFDSLSLLPHLQSHLIALTTATNSPLPKALIDMIQPLPALSVLHLASSLTVLFNNLEDFSSLGSSACPSACALFIAALEGQAASSLPSYTILARELGAKTGARKDLVIACYRDVSKILEQWMAEVPWLSDADHPDNRLGSKRRKISRRDVVASGIRDVVQFRENIVRSQKAREAETSVTLALEVTEELDGSRDGLDTLMRQGRKRKRSEDLDLSQPSRSLRLVRSRPSKSSVSQVDLASLSLLSPSHPFAPDLCSSDLSEHSCQADSMQNQLLTSEFPTEPTLTRLQRLAVSRGGENEIRDDELFEQNELENFLRSEDEVIKLRGLFGWDEADPKVTIGDNLATPTTSSSQRRDWELADLAVWEDIGSNREVDSQSGEQILGEWREVSPFTERPGEEDGILDVHSEW